MPSVHRNTGVATAMLLIVASRTSTTAAHCPSRLAFSHGNSRTHTRLEVPRVSAAKPRALPFLARNWLPRSMGSKFMDGDGMRAGIMNVGQLRMATSAAQRREDLSAEWVGIEGRIATLKVREDGQGTTLQGLRVDFEGGGTGTVLWQRTPLLYVLVDQASIGGDTESISAKIDMNANVTVPAGKDLLGRVVNYRASPLDGGPSFDSAPRRPMFGVATVQSDLATISKPLHTGITAVDALTPIGRGQNMLIVGSEACGRRQLTIDAVLNQANEDVACIYVCADEDYEPVLTKIKDGGAFQHTCFVALEKGGDAVTRAALMVAASSTACGIAEEFRRNGKDTLVVIDTLDLHKVFWDYTDAVMFKKFGVGSLDTSALNAASSEMRAFFSSLIQRVGYLNKRAGGGSLSLLLQVDKQDTELKADKKYEMADFDPSVYGAKVTQRLQLMVDKGIKLTPEVLAKLDIPAPEVQAGASRFKLMMIEDLMSMSDGQIMLTDKLLQEGLRPPLDTRSSLTRIGIGENCLSMSSSQAMRTVASALRFEMAQATDIPKDYNTPDMKKQRARANAWSAAMHQEFGARRTLGESIAVLLAASKGYMDKMFLDSNKTVPEASKVVGELLEHLRATCSDVLKAVTEEKDLSFQSKKALTAALDSFFAEH